MQEQDNFVLLAEQQAPEERVFEFVLKVAERCNIACNYCYMYEAVDKSYRGRPSQMPFEVLEALAAKVHDYATQVSTLTRFIFHGGEPLLREPEFFRKAVDILNYAGQDRSGSTLGGPRRRVRYGIHTNGTRLNEKYLDELEGLGIQVSVSLDGDQRANDRSRLFRNGDSSYGQARRGAELLAGKYPHLFGGVLAVMNLANDPIEMYESLNTLKPPTLDFLPPLGNWTYLPPGRSADPTETPYGDQLIRLFDHWTDRAVAKAQGLTDEHVPRIGFFEEIIKRIGAPSHEGKLELLGNGSYAPNLMVETDGSLHLVDSLKTTAENASALNLSVFDRGSLATYEVAIRQQMHKMGVARLAQLCLDCELKQYCRGGFYPNRYDESQPEGQRFTRPSVYHPDLYKLISHMKRELVGTEENLN
jgi:uncharacterized protein